MESGHPGGWLTQTPQSINGLSKTDTHIIARTCVSTYTQTVVRTRKQCDHTLHYPNLRTYTLFPTLQHVDYHSLPHSRTYPQPMLPNVPCPTYTP